MESVRSLYLKIAKLTNNEKSLLTRWCRISMLDISAKRGYTVYFRWAFGDAFGTVIGSVTFFNTYDNGTFT